MSSARKEDAKSCTLQEYMHRAHNIQRGKKKKKSRLENSSDEKREKMRGNGEGRKCEIESPHPPPPPPPKKKKNKKKKEGGGKKTKKKNVIFPLNA